MFVSYTYKEVGLNCQMDATIAERAQEKGFVTIHNQQDIKYMLPTEASVASGLREQTPIKRGHGGEDESLLSWNPRCRKQSRRTRVYFKDNCRETMGKNSSRVNIQSKGDVGI